jgi:aerobic-type carbon monoxide dehydrogenase small subunit (CoxS/CutS family)
VCTVLLEGRNFASCSRARLKAAITTIEGLAGTSALPQAAFTNTALSSAVLHSWMILSAKSFLDENPGRHPPARRSARRCGHPVPLHRLQQDRRRGGRRRASMAGKESTP